MNRNGIVVVALLAVSAVIVATDIPCVAQGEFVAGTSARSARAEAIQAIPFDQLSPPVRERTMQIINSAAIYRRMPVTTIDCDPDLYLFAIRYPEIIVDIWRLMGASTMTLQRTGQFNLACDDGAGTTSNIELVYGTPTTHVYVAKGRHRGSRLLTQLDGSCVILVQTEYHRGPDGQPQATSSLDVFVDIDNSSAEWVIRIVSPLFGGTADRNFVESLKFLEKLSATTAENGPGVIGMAERMTGVRPEVRSRFAQIAEVVYERNLTDPRLGHETTSDDDLQQTNYQPFRATEATESSSPNR